MEVSCIAELQTSTTVVAVALVLPMEVPCYNASCSCSTADGSSLCRDFVTRQEPNNCSRLALVYLGVLRAERVETEGIKV